MTQPARANPERRRRSGRLAFQCSGLPGQRHRAKPQRQRLRGETWRRLWRQRKAAGPRYAASGLALTELRQPSIVDIILVKAERDLAAQVQVGWH